MHKEFNQDQDTNHHLNHRRQLMDLKATVPEEEVFIKINHHHLADHHQSSVLKDSSQIPDVDPVVHLLVIIGRQGKSTNNLVEK